MRQPLPKPKKLALAIAASLAGPTLVTGCAEDKVDASIFADIPACIAAGNDTLACENGFAAATERHAELAPRFTNLADCEGEFGAGACGDPKAAGVDPAAEEGRQQHTAGGGYFFPLMAGYLIGSTMGRAGAQPLYRGSTGSWRNAAGHNLGARAGAVSVSKAAAAVPAARTTVTSRGGFSAPRASRTFGG